MGFLLVGMSVLTSPARERGLVLAALGIHFLVSLSLYWIMENIFISSDVHIYLDDAVRLLRPLIRQDPQRYLVETLKMICQLPNDVPLESGPTASMIGVTAIGMYLTDSVWAMFLLYTLFSFVGKWGIYAAFRDELKLEDTRSLFFATMLIPSCVYWTSGLVKEAFALCGLGALFRGAQLLLRGVNLTSPFLLAFGFILVGGFKPFFLFAFVIGVSIWAVLAKSKRRISPFTPFIFAGVTVLAVLGLAVLGTKYKEFAVDRVVETVAEHQLYGMKAEGGSNYQMGDPNARSVAGQIAYAPLAFFTTLARPLPFEIHNVTSAIAAAELLAMSVLLGQSLRRGGLRNAWRHMFAQPVLVFAFVFTIVAATGVGLATTNFGTLSRYRTPILPFYAALILGVRHAERKRREAPLVPTGSPSLVPRLVGARQARLGGATQRRRRRQGST
jgi:hypothetical protein